MKLFAYQRAVLIFLACLLSNGCSGDRDAHLLSRTSVSPSSPAAVIDNKTQSKTAAIRAVDFANFEYPLAKHGDIKLRDGKHAGNAKSDDYPFSLSHLTYGDVTRDGSEEAIVVLFENVRGSAIPYYVFIYSMVDGSPKLLWSFETGDRADGGLRQVYADAGNLVIELYGKGTSVGGKLYTSEEGACCPKFFSRTRYQWDRDHFVQDGDIQVSANPSSGAAVIMPRYQSSN